MATLKKWIKAATSDDMKMLVDELETTRGYLYQLSNKSRQPSALLALHIEQATTAIHRITKRRLPIVEAVSLRPELAKVLPV